MFGSLTYWLVKPIYYNKSTYWVFTMNILEWYNAVVFLPIYMWIVILICLGCSDGASLLQKDSASINDRWKKRNVS